jgi:hypothetical protein
MTDDVQRPIAFSVVAMAASLANSQSNRETELHDGRAERKRRVE